MSRKDYIIIAEAIVAIIKKHKSNKCFNNEEIIDEFVKSLRDTNPIFDCLKFREYIERRI